MTDLDALDVETMPRADLPRLLGRVTEIEARIRLRLAEVPTPSPSTSRTIDADEAAVIAATSKRWIVGHTRGMKFRADLSRKQPRFIEDGLRAWLASRGRS
jgi:hypothetical protein